MRYVCFCIVVLLIGGCGGGNMAAVSGTVTLDGKPLASATVIFIPDSSEKNPGPTAVGITDAQGRYTLTASTGAGSGAVIGKHKVSITSFEGDGEQSSDPNAKSPFRKSLVPEQYNAHTTLTFDVTSGGSTTANFDLKSGPAGKK